MVLEMNMFPNFYLTYLDTVSSLEIWECMVLVPHILLIALLLPISILLI